MKFLSLLSQDAAYFWLISNMAALLFQVTATWGERAWVRAAVKTSRITTDEGFHFLEVSLRLGNGIQRFRGGGRKRINPHFLEGDYK